MKKEIGLRIKNIRENMNLSKDEFAKKLGISGQFLGMVEKVKNFLSIEKLKTLCEFTNLSADYILFGKDKNLVDNTKKLLYEFSNEEIANGCETIKKLAIFMKNI